MSDWLPQAMPEISDAQFARWQTMLEERTGISFLQHKNILMAGLNRRMRELGISDYASYYQQLTSSPEADREWRQLVDRIAVNETSFFRDPLSFAVLQSFLQTRLGGKTDGAPQRMDIWSVGCASGEEAWSLAMMATDLIEHLAIDCRLAVTGSDISDSVLATARRGCYSARRLEKLSLTMRNRYFKPLANQPVKLGLQRQYRISPALGEKVRFVPCNILDIGSAKGLSGLLPGRPMDVIYCQNLLVYFRRERQWQALDQLQQHLKPGGMLMVGPGEVTGWQHPDMQRIKRDGVQAYVKIEDSDEQ